MTEVYCECMLRLGCYRFKRTAIFGGERMRIGGCCMAELFTDMVQIATISGCANVDGQGKGRNQKR